MSASERPPLPGWAVEVSEVLTERRWAFSALDCGTHYAAGEHPRMWLRARCGHLLLRSAAAWPYPRRWPCQPCVAWLIRGQDNPGDDEIVHRFCAAWRPRVALAAALPRAEPLASAA